MDSLPATVPSVVPTGDCSHWSIHYIHKANRPISGWMDKVSTQNTQNGKTVLPIANLMADSESESPSFYSSFLVTIHLSRSVSEIFACDRQTDGQTMRTITITGLHCGGPANKVHIVKRTFILKQVHTVTTYLSQSLHVVLSGVKFRH